MSRVGETGVGEMGIGETGVGEMGVGETGPNRSLTMIGRSRIRNTKSLQYNNAHLAFNIPCDRIH